MIITGGFRSLEIPPGNLKTVAIIVNYKSARLTLRAVESVLQSESLGPVCVVVVDNSEDENEAARLRLSLPQAVTLLVNGENMGFGRACNLAFERFPGHAILLINPDARLLPECLLRLQKTLFGAKRAAAVTPHIFWDEGLKFYLPSSYPRTILEIQALFDSRGPQAYVNRLLSAIWRYHSIRIWRAKRPVRVKNLSGSLVLLNASAVQKGGGLFDPRFFLYFEDTDLFIRLRQAGYSLLVEPRAEAIHYYDQCGQENREQKRSLMVLSHEIFLEKHEKGWTSRLRRRMSRFKTPGQGERYSMKQADFTSPFTLDVPAHLREGWLFEWSPFPTLLPSVGRFGKGPLMDFPEECWGMLAPGQYFGRFGRATAFGRYSQVVSWVVGENIARKGMPQKHMKTLGSQS